MNLNGKALNTTPPLNGYGYTLSSDATNFLEIEQIVEYRESAEATNFLEIEQTLKAYANATNFLTIAQRVIETTSVLTGCNDWNANIYINGALIPRNQIIGQITIERSENSATLCSFTRKMPVGAIDPDENQGDSVAIDIEQGSGFVRAYTGIVDIPEYDIVKGHLTYKCTDRRRELINNQLSITKKNIGYWSDAIFGEAEDTYDEVQDRLSTVMQSVDFDAYGNYNLTDLNPKATPDFTLTDSDVYRDEGRDPVLALTSRARVINKINLGIQYRFPKLYHWQVGYTWEDPYADNICQHFQSGKYLATRSAIEQAALGGWPIKGDITFDPVWPSGWYRCGAQTVGWSTQSFTSTPTPLLDASGNQVKDSNGNIVYDFSTRVIQDVSSLLTLGASWTATNRWSQTITEEYNIVVQAPQSQTKFGDVTQSKKYGLTSDYDTTDWENYTQYDTKAFNESGVNGSVVIDKDINRTDANNAIITALNLCKTTILKSHRDNRVTFTTDIWPEVDLKHTVRLNCTNIDITGKVSGIRHTLDVSNKKAETVVELSFSQSEGSTTATAISVPSAPTYTATQKVTTIPLTTHIGKNPATWPGADQWAGFITPGYDVGFGNHGQTYAERNGFLPTFVVLSPEVQSEARDSQTVTKTATYNVEIPNDSLSLTKTGGC